MKKEYKSIEELVEINEEVVEVELMLTSKELRNFAAFCIKNDIKFNDWIRKLAYEGLEKDL